ncbi:MAG: RNA chaperone Hfq [Acidobacteria bacterium]|nr:RNA chaperone Hfq [Acidobacteriota bacterium]
MSFRSFSFPRRAQKSPPPDETFKEAEYLRSLGERQKTVSVKLLDGQVVRGWIEYYDQRMIRLTREGEPNLFIFKDRIAYIAEDNRKPGPGRRERAASSMPAMAELGQE